MKRATKAPPRIRETSGSVAQPQAGTRLARTPIGIVVIGELAHELPQDDINLAYGCRVLVDPEPIYEVLA